MSNDDAEEVFVAILTREEYDAIGRGESVAFPFDGAVIEQDPTFVVEVADE